MGRLWQVFSGPDALENQPDDRYTSPWTYPAQVRIPMEHWQAIIAFARAREDTDADFLERMSVLDGASFDPGTLTRFVRLLETLANAVTDAPRLTPDTADPGIIPEPMPNTSHAQMLRDVARLIARTKRIGAAFDSWVE
ncbi:hypothetical protein MWU54_11670 [Marivita sp. S6314]|uniref:hypothetical protein n=1 Tax=Marivita sp. S6314 TaxID=2926406 RepID=UPI001FF38994|nr:hypothetical protein [Marivita sp. S6314]MCK0150686.1 hypothetical protein [Marivita sp. S6314]